MLHIVSLRTNPPTLKTAQKGLLLLIVLLTAILASMLWQHTAHKPTISLKPTTTTVISDKNYSLTLPANWKAEGSYVSGSGLGVFISHSAAATKTNSRLVVFVTPVSKDITAQTHVDNELAALKKNGSAFAILEDKTIEFGQSKVKGRRITALVGKPSDPNSHTYYVYVALTNKDTLYNLDVSVPAATWTEQDSAIYTALSTFEPKATTINRAIEQ